MPNVEETEGFYPLLMLWRRIVPDSGGAGRFRGGNSMELAAVTHGVDTVLHHTASAAHHAVPLTPLFGGYPGNVNRFLLQRGTDVRKLLGDGRVPAPDQAQVGEEEELAPKAFGIPQGADDIYILRWCGAGGYGDPLARDPAAVAEDVRAGMVSADEAQRLCGVVLSGDGDVDEAATKERRDGLKEQRREWAAPPEDGGAPQHADANGNGGAARPLGPGLKIHGSGGTAVIACGECDTVLAGGDGNWKDGARRRELPIQEGNALIPDPGRLVDGEIVLRQFACPSCLTLLDSEVCRSTDPPLWDIRIGGNV
jgi:N-methylhydantoinase B